MDKQQIHKFMQKPMDRRQFLKHTGLVIVAFFFSANILSLIFHPEKHLEHKASRGFGGGKFGA